MKIITAKDLKKNLKSRTIINKINLTIKNPSLFGFIGPNGAGKTTTMNMLTGIIPPSSGSIEIFGMDIEKYELEIKQRIGVLTEEPALFDYLSGEEQLYFVGRIYDLSKKQIQERSSELFELFDLKKHKNKPIIHYSLGMRKKLGLACAFIHNPDVLFLDEPFGGLDFISIQMLQDLLKLANQAGTTIFLTSHNLNLVEKLCTEIAVIHQGEIILTGHPNQIKSNLENKNLETVLLDLITPSYKSPKLSWLG